MPDFPSDTRATSGYLDVSGDDSAEVTTADNSSAVCFFSDRAVSKDFDVAFTRKLSSALRSVMTSLLPPESVANFSHGRQITHPAATEHFDGGRHSNKAMLTARYVDLIEHNVEALANELFAAQMQMATQFQQMFFSTLSASCEQNGNAVDMGGRGFTMEAFTAIWEKLQVEVKPDGNPKLPDMLMGGEAFDEAQAVLENASPEEKAKLDAIKKRKIDEGRVREAARQAKFANYGEPK